MRKGGDSLAWARELVFQVFKEFDTRLVARGF